MPEAEHRRPNQEWQGFCSVRETKIGDRLHPEKASPSLAKSEGGASTEQRVFCALTEKLPHLSAESDFPGPITTFSRLSRFRVRAACLICYGPTPPSGFFANRSFALENSPGLIQILRRGITVETTMATIGTVAFLLLVSVAMLAKARFKERASWRRQMTDNAMRAMGN
ncbi:hypothetical protein N2603_22310 [Bradyrhizobium huanghuaihaiense]|nr:hypothetical protein [Bradyrhizobium sp. CB3035]UWU81100.1 hypothetical protein N2603_22310 [Bradyrhizobium sp. CB3035]